MKRSDLSNLNIRLKSLAIFRALLDDPVISALCGFLDCVESAPAEQAVSRYASFLSRLYCCGSDSLAAHIQKITADCENAFIRLVGSGKTPSPEMTACLNEELNILQSVADLTPQTLRQGLDWDGFLPAFPPVQLDIPSYYRARIRDIGKLGYGIYAQYRMFFLNPKGVIVPVRHPDSVTLASLVDYRREQQIILDNTQALLDGKPAANILLTGDAGTGKSSTVKAVVNELYGKGLRILEVRKEQLHQIPEILDALNTNPLKFILFIDDLSFQRDDDNFSALKAILEGSVSAKSQNVVIYATSNRRHLVKESFSDREGDDIHRNDTMQEIISLSERFGIQITFQRPDKKTYLDIVHHLARERGLTLSSEELDAGAERFVLGRGGRSARAASQYVDSLTASAKGPTQSE